MKKIIFFILALSVLSSAAEQMQENEITEQSSNSSEFLDSMKAKYSKLKDQAVAKLDKTIASSKESMTATIEDYVSDLEIITPYINELGYEIEMLQLDVTIPPKVYVYLNMHTDVSIKKQEEVIEYCAFQGLSTTVLELIVETSKAQKKLNIGEFKFKHMVIELGLIPTVQLKFVPKKVIPVDE